MTLNDTHGFLTFHGQDTLNWSQMMLNNTKWHPCFFNFPWARYAKLKSNDAIWCWMMPNDTHLFLTCHGQDMSNWSQMTLNDAKWHQMTPMFLNFPQARYVKLKSNDAKILNEVKWHWMTLNNTKWCWIMPNDTHGF